MAVYEGYQAIQDHLLHAARACAAAAAKAPTLTRKLGLRMEILTGEDLKPSIDVLATMGQGSLFQRLDSTAYSKMLEDNPSSPVLLIGADLTEPIWWDCGGCGFPNCAEYVKYVRKNKGAGIGAYGPSCLWKVIDFGIAADYACAAAAQNGVEARIQFSFGAVSMFLNRMEGCSFILALPLGTMGTDGWFDRKSWAGALDYQTRRSILRTGAPNLSMAFTGAGAPVIKSKQQWWEDPDFMKIEKDPGLVERAMDSQAAAYEKIMRYAGALPDEEEAEEAEEAPSKE